LLIIRHARAEIIAKSDRVRKLSEEGQAAAIALGCKLHEAGISADMIVSSPAVRAETTAQLIARGINYSKNAIVSEEFLYHAHPEEIISFIRNLDDKVESLLIVGHNPALFETVNLLGPEQVVVFRPGQALRFQFDVASWKGVDRETCKSMMEIF
ncbi:MAG: histidine phosphatase family protein, partial [Victivallaceae bacterium]